MKASSITGLLLAVALLGSGATVAHAREPDGALLHALFQDHMVLQRDATIRVWGHADPGEQVSVMLDGTKARARTAADGTWEATLPTRAAGGPYDLVVEAGAGAQTVRDVYVGDVWLCAGQSNMELPVWRALDASSEIASAAHPRIRLFTVPQAGAVAPQSRFQGDARWQVASPDSVRDFSAACFYFARELQKTVDVPMGLIQAAWGGSRIEAWTSATALRTGGGSAEALDVLALYATDTPAALARWGRHWERWWTVREGATPGDAPWRADAPDTGWRTAPATLGAWERWGVPALDDYNGMVWYRTQVTLTAAQATRGATLELGPADETDMTWVNGTAVGSRYGAGEPRRYPLPSGLLKAGINTVVVNVLDTYRDGGLAGPASAHALTFDDGTRVVLDSRWRYRPEPGADEPPRAPWHTASGVSTLYNGMIAPLGAVGLRGMLWYQGESNTGDGAAYAVRLRTLRDDWRQRFGAQVPWVVVQLAGYGLPPSAPVESGWAQVREAQRRVVAEDPHSELVVAIDIGDAYDIHPPNKQELGRRLARVARHVVYGERALAPSGPTARAAARAPDGVRVAFDDVTGALVTTGANGPIGFELCDAAKRCDYADAALDGRYVVLRSPRASNAMYVRYCWADGPVCTLRDTAGLPAGPFELPVPAVEVPR
ncbi:sialate O-acetylesterase [Pseudoxanthomonas sp. 3HH-4]|uniref:sialate O-acetylesterase n=1 Tax=Pseudoxanthomonas sp. 3HH-4 TaxID=1690214 RepID=UPI001154B5F3|nr:sialate O-acetylesterase [Pseudoxanthomonas sp. 3HH-4]TQM12089.1 sialate O-acetylesterase [Pseudoxanthomonas sp. 3HH-4]